MYFGRNELQPRKIVQCGNPWICKEKKKKEYEKKKKSERHLTQCSKREESIRRQEVDGGEWESPLSKAWQVKEEGIYPED